MVLTGRQIEKYVKEGIISIDPFDPKQLNPNSYNIRLGNELLVYDNHVLNIKEDNPTHIVTIPEEGLRLEPGILYLGRTVEYTKTPPISNTEALVVCIDGRSSLARHGISCHIAAGYGDIGFEGTFTCELSCVQPVVIFPNILIGQLYYMTTLGETDIVYNGKYQGQIEATKSRFYMDIDK